MDAALRNDTTVMLVDDPVKRVDNMTMAWGLEARVPFLDHELVELAGRIPPELKLADGGKGVLKRAARGVVPDEVIDRTKGYFPVPAIRQLEGPYLERVREALTDPAASGVACSGRTPWRPDAGRPERHPDDPGLERAVAAGAAGDVAAEPWHRRPTRSGTDPRSAAAASRGARRAWGSWGPNMTPDAGRVAFISDRQALRSCGCSDLGWTAARPPDLDPLSDDPVVSVRWSADSAWLACAVATDGGVRTQVWVVRPDGTDARRIAGDRQHAELGPWTRSGHRVTVIIPGSRATVVRTASWPTRRPASSTRWPSGT